jgi:hypothetical protein
MVVSVLVIVPMRVLMQALDYMLVQL